MKTGNGRTAQPKKGAEMVMGGPIHLQLTQKTLDELLRGEETNIDLGVWDLDLQLSVGDIDRVVEFRPYFAAYKSVVVIENDVADNSLANGAELHDDIEVSVKESDDRGFSFMLNPRQAAVLAEMLANYVKAWEIGQALIKEPVPIQPIA